MRPEEWPLEERYSLELLTENERVGRRDVIDFWIGEGAKSEAEAEVRVQEVLLDRDAVLAQRFAEGADTRGMGVIQELENEGLKRYFNRGWEPPTDMVFIGLNERGDHVRVHWFEGAIAPSRPVGQPRER